VNLREGTRRLALLLGAVGAILGGFASYLEFQSILNQKERHNKFEQLAASDVIQQARMDWVFARIPPDYDALAKKYGGVSIKQTVTQNPWAVVSVEAYYSDQQKSLVAAWKLFGQERRAELLEKMSPEQKGRLRALIEHQTQWGQDWFIENAPAPSSEVNKGGIKTVRWTKALGVESIETEDGQMLYPAPAPSLWLYLFAAILPLLGFILPFGLIRAVGWVGAGFVASSK